MKTKILSFILTIFVVGFFSSCEGPMGPMGPEGPAGAETWDVFEMTVEGQDWQWDKDQELFYFYFDESAISKFIAEKGSVQVAINFEKTYHPLPYVRNLYDPEKNQFVTETVSYEYGAGWIRFNFSANDLFDNLPINYKPGTHVFKVTLHW